jgi:DNA invertase Pin-like site-specific DNA recombinase
MILPWKRREGANMDRKGRWERHNAGALSKAKPGRASHFIDSFDMIERGDRIILACRVSWRDQKANLPEQRDGLHRAADAVGAKIVGEFSCVHSGKDPSWLRDAVRLAQRHGAAILARDTSRFIRHPSFDLEKNFRFLPRDCDFERLRDWTGDVRLVTFLDPDATREEINAFLARGNQGGRPAKRTYGQRWDDLDPATQAKIIRMLAAEASLHYVAKVFGRKRATVQNWRERLRREGKLAAVSNCGKS